LCPERIHGTNGREQDAHQDKAAEECQMAGFHNDQAPVMHLWDKDTSLFTGIRSAEKRSYRSLKRKWMDVRNKNHTYRFFSSFPAENAFAT
jgi:hypothetical protein